MFSRSCPTRSNAANVGLTPLDPFVLPGGTAAAAYPHLAHTATRRAERLDRRLASTEQVNLEAIPEEGAARR